VKKAFYYMVWLFAFYGLASCGTTKNTKVRRFYHALTSNYNIYYNGKTAFDEALASMQNGYQESYTDQILMYPISAQPKDKPNTGGPFDRAIEKGNKAVKTHSIQTKPAKKPGWRNDPRQRAFQEQEEYNPFLKHCWLLIGQAQFYNADFLQASATFSYIARHYAPDEEMVAEARLWQARCYAEMNWLYEAADILGKLNTNGIPEKNLNRYASVYADYSVKNKNFEEAIPYLQTAIKAEKNKRQRSRMKYLLGQLYAGLELDNLAYQAFGEVVRSNPPYELEFAARIRQTEVFPGGNEKKVIRMLESMARNEKNKDYLDQVYYALGNVFLIQGDTLRAIRSYETGAEKSVRNGMDKAVLWIKLGDLYFNMRDYIKAQPCFSGASAIIQKEYKDYERVARLSAVLDELVVHAEAIHLQDSLQRLGRMPEEERLAAIDLIIAQLIREEEEAKAQAEKETYLAGQEAMETGFDRPGTGINAPALPTTAGGSAFYFYNPQMVAQGKTQFQRKWGRRTLEDDWRRRNKQVSTFMENTGEQTAGSGNEQSNEEKELTAAGDSLANDLPENLSDDPKTREYYLQQIPFTQEELEASDLIIIDGLYNMAMIYKDKLEDLSLAIEGFEELESRFPANHYLLESYYQVYLLALRTRNAELAGRYKAKMTAAFPESDYTLAISDPDYEHQVRSMDSVQASLYEASYYSYLSGDTAAVRRNYESISAGYPLAGLLPKFMFLYALTYVQQGDAEGFKEALKALVEKYPKADVAELAGEMLKGVLRGREMVQGDVRGMSWNLRFGLAADGTLSAADSARTFTTEANQPCRILLMYPPGRIDDNQLLYAVAAYNFANFIVKEFDLSLGEAGPLRTLNISSFIHFDEALQYYRMIYGKDGYASVLNNEIVVLPISDDNFTTLMRGKTLEEYALFLEENFASGAAELIARLRARLDATLMEEVPLPIPEETAPSEPEETVLSETEKTTPPEPEEITPPELEETTLPEPEEAFRQAEESQVNESPVATEAGETTPLPGENAESAAPATSLPQQETLKTATEPQKTPAQIRKEKEREYKKRQQLKAKERKEKERAYKQKLKEREKARREAQKAGKRSSGKS
jgi:tetratricopeptide (TPR) repeat protein